MYSHVFNFRFEESVSEADRMRFLADMFELPEKSGGKSSDVYWCTVEYDGFVEFYSNKPELTALLKNQLHGAEASGLLKQVSPGLRSALKFISRMVFALCVGLTVGLIRSIFRIRK